MDLKVGDKVDLIVVRNIAIGFTVLVNEEFEGMLYKNELYEKIEEGQKMVGYVKQIREDGKLDVTLQAVGFKQTIVKNEIIILKILKENNDFLELNDKSSPDDIKYKLGMSKKAFKSAIGGLFRQKLIAITDKGIEIVQRID